MWFVKNSASGLRLLNLLSLLSVHKSDVLTNCGNARIFIQNRQRSRTVLEDTGMKS